MDGQLKENGVSTECFSTSEEKVVPFNNHLTYEDVAARLGYDPVTGDFTWLIDVGKNVKAGSRAGSVKTTRKDAAGNEVKYLYIRMLDRTIPAARLAWLLHFGRWPEGRIAPKNGNTLDLSIENLVESRPAPDTYDHSDPEDRKRYHRDLRSSNPIDYKARDLERRFGIDFQTYCQMIAAQGNRCAICGEEETVTRDGQVKALAVDHCHSTGGIRELLCQMCNQTIGFSKDDPERLRKAADYLEKHKARLDNVVALTKKDA